MKVIFASGGSGGPVAPLLAIYEQLKVRDPQIKALWIGTRNGVEKEMIKPYGLELRIISSAKWRRYFDLRNLLAPIQFLIGYLQSYFIIKNFQPEVILTAGSFVAVPVVYAARLKKIPTFIHQQDFVIGLANKLMVRVATAITVTFAESVSLFPKQKTYLVGNPVRSFILQGQKERACKTFNLKNNLATIFVVGGGQGAELINQRLLEILTQLVGDFQVIHQTGIGKKIDDKFIDYFDRLTLKNISANYRSYEIMNGQEMADAYALADLVVCRAGLGTLTELAILQKAALLIPLSGHQQVNAQYFAKNNAVKVLAQEDLNKEKFIEAILGLMNTPAELQALSRNIGQLMIKDSASKYVDLIEKIIRR